MPASGVSDKDSTGQNHIRTVCIAVDYLASCKLARGSLSREQGERVLGCFCGRFRQRWFPSFGRNRPSNLVAMRTRTPRRRTPHPPRGAPHLNIRVKKHTRIQKSVSVSSFPHRSLIDYALYAIVRHQGVGFKYACLRWNAGNERNDKRPFFPLVIENPQREYVVQRNIDIGVLSFRNSGLPLAPPPASSPSVKKR